MTAPTATTTPANLRYHRCGGRLGLKRTAVGSFVILCVLAFMLATVPQPAWAAPREAPREVVQGSDAQALFKIIADEEYILADRFSASSRLDTLCQSGDADATFWWGMARAKHLINQAGAPYGQRDLPFDPDLAVRFWEAAAKAGHIQANLELGNRCAQPASGKPNIVKAARYWVTAAEQGNEEAIGKLRANLPAIEAEVEGKSVVPKVLAVFADKGEVSPALRLGAYYLNSGDYKLAQKYLRLAASKNEEAARLLAEAQRRATEQEKAGRATVEDDSLVIHAAKPQDDSAKPTPSGADASAEGDRTTSRMVGTEQPQAISNSPHVLHSTGMNGQGPQVNGQVAPNNPKNSIDRVLFGVVLVWAAISLIGLVAGLKGGIIVYRGWGDVVLAALCLSGIVFLISVCTDISGSPGAPLPWPVVAVIGLLGIFLLVRDYQTNQSVFKALLALLTQLFIVGLLLALAVLSISKITDFTRSKNRRERMENGLGALAALAGTGLVAYLLNKLVSQGRAQTETPATSKRQIERIES